MHARSTLPLGLPSGLHLGLSLALPLALGACVPGPLVVATPPGREPITNLDAMEDGQTELSGALGASVLLDDDGPSALFLDAATLGPPWTLAAAHSIDRFELRAAWNKTILWNQGNLGVGVRLPSLGAWDFAIDGGYAFGGYADTFTIEEGDESEAAELREPGTYSYAYRMHAPYGRARAVYRVRDGVSIPLALRMSHAWTQNQGGVLPQELQQQSFPELSVGVILTPPRTCLQAGVGIHYTVLPDVYAPMVQGALSCVFAVKERT
ncbi:MAG: hypothetical protein VX899_16995 [Myxococcota bacterium]|nr:hypothetical protein [Myxococcota bacterium]